MDYNEYEGSLDNGPHRQKSRESIREFIARVEFANQQALEKQKITLRKLREFDARAASIEAKIQTIKKEWGWRKLHGLNEYVIPKMKHQADDAIQVIIANLQHYIDTHNDLIKEGKPGFDKQKIEEARLTLESLKKRKPY